VPKYCARLRSRELERWSVCAGQAARAPILRRPNPPPSTVAPRLRPRNAIQLSRSWRPLRPRFAPPAPPHPDRMRQLTAPSSHVSSSRRPTRRLLRRTARPQDPPSSRADRTHQACGSREERLRTMKQVKVKDADASQARQPPQTDQACGSNEPCLRTQAKVKIKTGGLAQARRQPRVKNKATPGRSHLKLQKHMAVSTYVQLSKHWNICLTSFSRSLRFLTATRHAIG